MHQSRVTPKISILKTVEQWLPPAIYRALRGRLGNRFEGNYSNWDAASASCGGYHDFDLAERVAESTQAVVDGHAQYERDGERFDEIEYSWPALACLLLVACRNHGNLRVVDFGGGLGTTYRQNAKFLSMLTQVRWAVVEQPTFVALGRKRFTTNGLGFFSNVESAIAEMQPHVILLSGVLQYLPEPHRLLDTLLGHSVPYLLFDRTPTIAGARDRLTVQKVPSHINRASYPAWFFSRSELISRLERRYTIVERFVTADRANIPSAAYEGSLWQLRGDFT